MPVIVVKRPFVLIASFLVLGILISRYTSDFFLLSMAAVAATAAVFALTRRRRVFFLPVLSVVGFVLMQKSFAVDGNSAVQSVIHTESISMTGRITDQSFSRNEMKWITVRADYGGGYVNVRVFIESWERFELGRYITVSGQPQNLSFARNPGGYDESRHLRSRKIAFKMYADEFDLEDKAARSPILFIRNFRFRVSDIIDELYPARAAGIVKALIIGVSTDIEPEIRDIYRSAGIFHILAVSGLHVGIIAAAVYRALFAARLSERKISALTMLVLAAYCVFTGAGTATVRAVMMCYVILFGKILPRHADTVNSAAFAAFCLLIYEPLLLWDIGFIYTFSAVAGLSLLTPVIEKAFYLLSRRFNSRFLNNAVLKKYTCGCIAAWLCTVPVSAYFFYSVSFVAVFVNILLVPTVGAVVISGFISVAVGLVSLPAASVFAGAAYSLVNLYETVAAAASRLPFASVVIGRPPVYLIVVYVMFLFIAVILFRMKRRFKYKRALYAAMPAVVGLLFAVSVFSPQPARITFLDVGQGDSAVISVNGRAVIIDGGGNLWQDIDRNTGERVLIPYLDYRGIGRVEAAFISHMHEDHAIGIIGLMNTGRLKRLYLADAVHEMTPFTQTVIRTAELTGTEVVYVSAGDVIRFREVTVEVLYPQKGLADTANNQSQVLRVGVNGVSVLFTGDIESQAEISAAAVNPDGGLAADILKVPHHGSRTSSSEGFLAAVSPRLAIASVGERNVYGHPYPDVTARYAEWGITLFSTAETGAVTVYPGERTEAVTMRDRAGK